MKKKVDESIDTSKDSTHLTTWINATSAQSRLAELPTVAAQTVQEPGRLAAVSDALSRRGCSLDSKASRQTLEGAGFNQTVLIGG